MLVRRTIRRDSLANFVGISLNAVLQLIQIPILTSVWSAHQFGVWLMLATIPTYIAISEVGFATVATSDMAMSFARGDGRATVRTYRSLWALHLVICVVATLVFLLGLYFFADQLGEYVNAAIYFLIYALAGLCSRVVLAGFRATGLYAAGGLTYDGSTFVEGLAIMAIAYSGGSFEVCVQGALLIRLTSMAAMNFALGRLRPSMSLGLAEASIAEVRRLLKPALGAAVMPIAIAANIQGMVLLVGAVLSPVAVAVLTPVRTASRLPLQVISAVNRASMVSVSAAVANNDSQQVAYALRVNLLSVLLVHVPSSLLFCFIGKWFVEFWTGGRIAPPVYFVVLMGVAALVHGIWYFISNLLISVSEHVVFSSIIPVSTALTVLVAAPAGYFGGLAGIGSAVLLGEAINFVVSLFFFKRSRLWSVYVQRRENVE